MAQDQESSLIRLTGLWKNESKTGATYLVGKLSPSSKILILPNTHKQQASEPDYIAFLAPQLEKKDKEAAPASQAANKSWL